MANVYGGTLVLSKIKIGESYYYLKDAAARTAIDAEVEARAAADASIRTDFAAADTQIRTDFAAADSQVLEDAKSYVDSEIAKIHTVEYTIVSELPTADATNYFNASKKVYMIKEGTSGNDVYSEYICMRSGEEGSYTYAWEKIGDTRIDLSNYYTKTEVDSIVADLAASIGSDIQDAITEAEDYADEADNAVKDELESFVYTAFSEYDAEIKTYIDSADSQVASDAANAANNAEEEAKGYADDLVAGIRIESDGNHNHEVTASGTITPVLNKTEKHLTASVSTGVAVGESGHDTFMKSVAATTSRLVTSSFVTSVGKTSTTIEGVTVALGTGADSECLIFTAQTATFDAVGTVDTGTAATGGTATDASGDVIATGLGTPVTADAVTGVQVTTQPVVTLADTASTGGISFLADVAGSNTDVAVTGAALYAGAHTHKTNKEPHETNK